MSQLYIFMSRILYVYRFCSSLSLFTVILRFTRRVSILFLKVFNWYLNRILVRVSYLKILTNLLELEIELIEITIYEILIYRIRFFTVRCMSVPMYGLKYP